MKHHAWIAAALAGASTTTMAQTLPAFDQRLELGLELGRAEQAISHRDVDNQIDEADQGYRVFASYYFTPMVALRAGYADLGSVTFLDESFREDYLNLNVDQLSDESSPTAITVGGVFSLPIDQLPFVFALEFGLMHWNLDYEFTFITTPDGGATQRETRTYSSSDVGFYGGGNLSYQFTPAFGVGLSALWYVLEPEIDGDNGFEMVVQTLNLQLFMRF